MTLFLSYRSQAVGGPVAQEPKLFEADGLTSGPLQLGIRNGLNVAEVAGRDIVFATHGFNVSRDKGVRSLSRLERDLTPSPSRLFIGILWPGDFWIPVINYPAEAADAVTCGRLVATFANTSLRSAATISFVSHSLGARLILEAVKNLDRPAQQLCLAAPAVDDNCLATQYDRSRLNATRISVLASRKDFALRVAYRIGDWASDVIYDDDDPWRCALGFHGPRPTSPERVAPAQIPDAQGYDHGDYFPPSDLKQQNVKSQTAVKFIAECLSQSPHAWP